MNDTDPITITADNHFAAIKHRYLYLLPNDKQHKKVLQSQLLLNAQPYPKKVMGKE